MDLVCVGDVMLDIRVDAQTLKRGGDVHGSVLLQPGGTSSNAAVWAAWSGGEAHGCTGVWETISWVARCGTSSRRET